MRCELQRSSSEPGTRALGLSREPEAENPTPAARIVCAWWWAGWEWEKGWSWINQTQSNLVGQSSALLPGPFVLCASKIGDYLLLILCLFFF